MRGSAWVWLVGAGFLLGLPAPAVASPGSPRTAIVAMGDSFISGEGGRWLGNGTDPLATRSGTDRAAVRCDAGLCDYEPERVYGASESNRCHRSDVAPIESAPVAVDERVNLACSGARASDLWPSAWGGTSHFGEPPQAERLASLARRDEVKLIAVTVGANDVGFGGLVAECALDWARSSEEEPVLCREEAQDELEESLGVAGRGIRSALAGVRATMAAAGYERDDYRLVAVGYASPFPAGAWFRYPQSGWGRLTEGGCPVWNADASWAAGEATGAIVAAMRAASEQTGAEFLDLRHALDGHQLCDRRSQRVGVGGPSAASAEWVRRLSFLQGSSRESLHPNAYGQGAIGACIGLLYASQRGEYACRDMPGRGYVGAMRLEPIPLRSWTFPHPGVGNPTNVP